MLGAFLRLDILRQQPGGPELVGDIDEIEGAEDLDDHESRGEGLRDEGKAEDDGRQVDEVAKHEAEPHVEGFAKSGTKRTRDDRRHARTGNGGRDEEGSAIGKKGGEAHRRLRKFASANI